MAATLAALPLLTHGYSCGHDFDFHLRSWMEAAGQWKSGIVKPVWSFHAGWNSGEPRLLFYPPLSWIVGAFLSLIVPWSGIVFAYTWLVFVLCGITMHRLLRHWTSPAVATAGACLYIVNPYMLFCAYERTAYAELLAAAWMPLLLLALLREKVTAWRIAVALALLWLTNGPAGVIGCYTILIIAGMRLLMVLRQHRLQALSFTARVIAGVGLAFLLDSAYLLPFAIERKYITLNAALTPAASPDANYLYEFTADEFHNGVLLHSSNIAAISIALALVCGAVVLLHRRGTRAYAGMGTRDAATIRRPQLRSAALLLTLFSAIVLLLQLPLSSAVWHHAPELNFLQFPWRFLSIQGAVSVALLAMLLDHIARGHRQSSRLAAAALPACALLVVCAAAYGLANRTFRQGCDEEEGLQPQWATFHAGGGFEQTDEYTPVGDDNDALKIRLPEAWIAKDAEDVPKHDDGSLAAGTERPALIRLHPDTMVFTRTATSANEFLIVRLRPFHGWHVRLDGADLATWPQRPDGLLAVPLRSRGLHRVEVFYRKPWDQWAGSALTLLALGIVLMTARSEERRGTVQ